MIHSIHEIVYSLEAFEFDLASSLNVRPYLRWVIPLFDHIFRLLIPLMESSSLPSAFEFTFDLVSWSTLRSCIPMIDSTAEIVVSPQRLWVRVRSRPHVHEEQDAGHPPEARHVPGGRGQVQGGWERVHQSFQVQGGRPHVSSVRANSIKRLRVYFTSLIIFPHVKTHFMQNHGDIWDIWLTFPQLNRACPRSHRVQIGGLRREHEFLPGSSLVHSPRTPTHCLMLLIIEDISLMRAK